MSRPLVSVIMPAFNRQETLAYAIESVLNQTLRDFELILIDDASTDATPAIMEFYRERDNRIALIRNATNSRHGLVEWEPRNDGLKIARGRLIAYLDSDNLWSRDYLAVCTRAFETSRDVRLVHCNSRNHYRDRAQFELVLRHDKRRLVTWDEARMTAVFSYDASDNDNGISWYVDTNEMVHRADIFKDLHYLWATRHPDRQTINDAQLVRCVYRRHNDQELAERIIERYGHGAVNRVEDVLVEFFYAPRQHAFQSLRYEGEVARLLSEVRELEAEESAGEG